MKKILTTKNIRYRGSSSPRVRRMPEKKGTGGKHRKNLIVAAAMGSEIQLFHKKNLTMRLQS
jgi:hypothetical protein